MKNWLKEIVLEQNGIKLEPLRASHADELLWTIKKEGLSDLWYTHIPDESTIGSYISNALHMQQKGTALPFAIVDLERGKIIGSTRYCNIEAENKRLEIGYTWYASSYQRTKANTTCKLLLLRHAFEQLGCIAVEFRTNWFNFKSRNAILRLGAKQDGVLRNHRIDANGLLRDTVVFSILNSEWPTVQKNLEFKLTQHR